MSEVWILSAVRTPMGSFLGALSNFSAPYLGGLVIADAVKKAGISADQVDEVLMGCVLTAGMGQAPARQAALSAGLPKSVPSTTVGKVCGSGLKSVMLASQAIRCGDAKVVVAGGMESMSQTPYLVENMRQGHKFGHDQMADSMIKDGLWDPYNDFHMGEAAEMCAVDKSVTREAQDEFAKQSYLRAQEAQSKKYFEDEILGVEIKDRKGKVVSTFLEDEDVSKAKFEKFPNLKTVFKKDGTITAANASNLNDGAAALVLADGEWAKAQGLKPLAKIKGSTQAALEPEWFTMAPADAIASFLEKYDWSVEDVDLYEINEAFAVVGLAVSQKLGLDPSKVNIHGGAIAMGHPLGASGARILVTLLHAMKRLDKKKGVASLCIGGGEAVALGVER